MKLLRKLTNKEWKEIGEKYKDGGVHMYRGKRTLIYNGEILWDDRDQEYLIYDEDERNTWQVVIVMPGVEVIPEATFHSCCFQLETVIMADTVKTIKERAFEFCGIEFLKLSRNLEYIGRHAFYECKSFLASIFIPPSCREIGDKAFYMCSKLIIFSVPQHTQLGEDVIHLTALIEASPFEKDKNGGCGNNEDINNWIKNINRNEEYELHAACASFNPLENILLGVLTRQGLQAFRKENSIRVTPMQYLEANPFAEINQQKLIKQYIGDMMGESV